jgi:CRISPR-associated protein Csm4
MKTFKLTIEPRTAFGTPLAGDTLFGQLCWAVRERHGEDRLVDLLAGYTEGRPFLVVSDGFPEGFVPRPTVPHFALGLKSDPALRKRLRSYRWLPVDGVGQLIQRWMDRISHGGKADTFVLTQNTINRFTNTTGLGQFAPRQVDRIAFAGRLDVYVVIDEARSSSELFRQAMEDIGLHGFGRDATTGLGKFTVSAPVAQSWPQESGHYWLSLAPCAPNPADLDPGGCCYLPLTRFGRHGNLVVMRGQPFKSPLLMAATGALLKSREPVRWAFHGRGLGGVSNPISEVMRETVHQGFAPVLPLRMGDSA